MKNMDMDSVAEIIRFHRKRSGLSREKLAKLADLGKTAIFDVEHGKASVRFDTLLKILHVLNIQIEFQSPLMSLFKDDHEKS